MPDLNNIRMLVFDVDGILTDGSILVDDDGRETKRFHVRDGFALKAAMNAGLKVGILTGRSSRVVNLRMNELGVPYIMQGVRDKAIGMESLCQQAGVAMEKTAYAGDDLVDMPALLRVGYAMTVADAAAEVREIVHFVTRAPGGRGAVREMVEHILRGQDKWAAVVETYGM